MRINQQVVVFDAADLAAETPQQIHLDLWVDDVSAAHDEVLSLGAKVLKAAEESSPEARDNFQVYADPAGHPFCLCWIIR